jgi:hypothetical protein
MWPIPVIVTNTNCCDQYRSLWPIMVIVTNTGHPLDDQYWSHPLGVDEQYWSSTCIGHILGHPLDDLDDRCRTPVGQMIIFGKDPAGGNKLVS